MAYRFLGPIFTEIIIFYVYFCSLANLLLWEFPLNKQYERSLSAKLYILFYTIMIILIQYNYFNTAIKGPGLVPLNWQPENPNNKKFLQFCNQCNGYKAPRSHHCRRLNRCCLKMDHYCPWTGTTIGLNNQAYFYRFLIFVILGCSWSIYIIMKVGYKQLNTPVHVLYQKYYPNFFHYSSKALLMSFIGFGMALGTTLAVMFLLYQQTKILLSNKTSIEKWICEKAQDREKQEKEYLGENYINNKNIQKPQPFIYPYDLGRKNNILQVLGWHGCKSNPGFTGFLDWPVLENCGQFDLTVEQLSQKAMKKALSRKATIIENFSGWWLPILSFGCIIGCWKIPISDENRLKLDKDKNNKILVTRGYSSYWWYGQLIDCDDSLPRKMTRGWFPSRCVELDIIEETKKEQ